MNNTQSLESFDTLENDDIHVEVPYEESVIDDTVIDDSNQNVTMTMNIEENTEPSDVTSDDDDETTDNSEENTVSIDQEAATSHDPTNEKET